MVHMYLIADILILLNGSAVVVYSYQKDDQKNSVQVTNLPGPNLAVSTDHVSFTNSSCYFMKLKRWGMSWFIAWSQTIYTKHMITWTCHDFS
jgi:hypothetical protein